MTERRVYPELELIRIRPHHEHVLVMVGFHIKRIRPGQMTERVVRELPEVRRHAEFPVATAYRIAHGVDSIVRDPERTNRNIANRHFPVGYKLIHELPRDVFFVTQGDRRECPACCIYGDAKLPHQQRNTLDMIAVIVRHKARFYARRALSYLFEEKMAPDFPRYDRIWRMEIPENTVLREWVASDLEPWIKDHGQNTIVGLILIVDHTGISKCWYLDREGLVLLPSFYRQETDLLGIGTKGFHIPKKPGTYQARDSLIIDGIVYYLMESERFGSASQMYIVNGEGRFMGLQTSNGFSDPLIEQIRKKKEQYDEEKDILNVMAKGFSSLAKQKGSKKAAKDYPGTKTPGREITGKRASVKIRLNEKRSLLGT